MTTVTVHEAKTHFSRLLRQVEAGEEIVIARGSKPVAKLVRADSLEPRILGGDEGLITIPENLDDFELTDEEIALWYDEKIGGETDAETYEE